MCTSYIGYIKTLIPRLATNFSPFRSTGSRFQDIVHFIIPYLLLCLVKRTKKNKKVTKIQKGECHNSLNNFGKAPPQEYARILGSESVGYFQGRCRLKLFLSFDPMLTKTKKKIVKIKNAKFWITNKNCPEIWWVGYLFTKFGFNLLDTFWENGFYGWRQNIPMLCSSTKQSYKNSEI